MALVQTLIGNVKGPQGDTGATGAQGEQGEAATIEVGSVTTAAYGTAASVTNSGTENEAVLDFIIPQGAPGETVTDMQNLTLGSITSSSASFPVPVVGETAKVIFGKINKWFSDMAALVATKFDTANVVNNLATTDSGYALDARQGKALDESKASAYDLHYRRAAIIPENTSTTIDTLSLCKFGVIYGRYSNQWYTNMFDVASLGSRHQMYISQQAYCNYTADLQNNTFTVSTVVGFDQIIVVLYK